MIRQRVRFETSKARSIMHNVAVPVISIVLFLFAMGQGGFLNWFLFYAFVPIFLYQLLLFVYPFHTIDAERSIDDRRVTAGEALHVTVHLKRRWPLPFFSLTLYERPDFYQATNKTRHPAGLLIWIEREAFVALTVPGIPRGKHVLDELVLRMGDPFGFFERSVRLHKKTVIYVYPKARMLSMAELDLPRESVYASAQEMDPGSFAGIRAYQPSDHLSWLDWKSIARMNGPVTKEFEPERDRRAFIVLVSRKKEKDEYFERAISYTASLIQTILSRGFTILLMYRSDAAPLFLQKQSPQNMDTAFQALAELEKDRALESADFLHFANQRGIGYAVSTDYQLAVMMRAFAEKSRQHQTMYYISDQVPEEPVNSLRSLWFSMKTVTKKEGD